MLHQSITLFRSWSSKWKEMSTQLLPRSIFFSVLCFLWCYYISALHTFRLFACLLVKKLGFFYPPLFPYLLHRAMAFLPSIYPCILQIFSGLPNKTACLCKMVFQCCSTKSVEHARNKKGYQSPYQNWLLCLCSLSCSHPSYGLDKLPDDFFNGCAETKRLFSSKAEVSHATNVSWNAGNVWQGVKQLPWENLCSSVKVSARPVSVSEVINLVRCPRGSDSVPIKSSYAAGKWANDVWPKPSVKAITYGDLLTKAFCSSAPWRSRTSKGTAQMLTPLLPLSSSVLPWVKQLPQASLESKYFWGQVSAGEHSCLLYHWDMPLLRGKEELLHDWAVSSIMYQIHLDRPFPN